MLLVAGDAKHPKYRNCGPYYGKSGSVCQLGKSWKNCCQNSHNKIYFFAVAQTTFNVQSWETCKEF